MADKYEHEVAHHDPREGFDHSEPAARKITMFVIISVITLVVTIGALQAYFDKIWNQAVYEKVLAVPGEELGVDAPITRELVAAGKRLVEQGRKAP